ncbi:IclR family transcriptional regulator [Paenibacillus sp. P26]|nr:IclR family transcriptional regulator [Paenibacillus sp. P26]
MNDTGRPLLLSSVRNALRILQAFTTEHPERGVRELAKELQLSKSTVQRLVDTLTSEGFLVQNESTRKYRLGVPVLTLSRVVTTHLEIHQEALPHLQHLVAITNETALLSVLEGTRSVYLHKVEPKRSVRIYTEIGGRNPLYCTASGKALLAYQDQEFIERVMEEGLIPYTSRTITDPDTLRRHLSDIRAKGYAVSKGEYIDEEEIHSIAAPVRDYTGRVFAAVTITGPVYRLRPAMIEDYADKLTKEALEISKRIGYSGHRK